MATSPAVLDGDRLDNRNQLVATMQKVSVIPKDPIAFPVPGEVYPSLTELNLQQTEPFINSGSIRKLNPLTYCDVKWTVENDQPSIKDETKTLGESAAKGMNSCSNKGKYDVADVVMGDEPKSGVIQAQERFKVENESEKSTL